MDFIIYINFEKRQMKWGDCRMEKLNLRAQSSLAKCFGTMVSIIGALVVTLYKGVPFTSFLSLKFNGRPNEVLLLSQQSNWVFGGLLLSFAALSFAVILIVQVSHV